MGALDVKPCPEIILERKHHSHGCEQGVYTPLAWVVCVIRLMSCPLANRKGTE